MPLKGGARHDGAHLGQVSRLSRRDEAALFIVKLSHQLRRYLAAVHATTIDDVPITLCRTSNDARAIA